MSEKQFIFMTGATSGLGKVSALKAANHGATMLILARNKDKGIALQQEFKSLYPDSTGHIEIFEANLNSFNSVISQ